VQAFRFGLEEEYFVVDRRTGSLRCELPQAFMKAAGRKLGRHLMTELLQSQIEVATSPVATVKDAYGQLRYFRATLAEIGEQHGVGIVAAGTHPLAVPEQQRMTRKRRYAKVIDELGMVGLGNALCGLHVHVEVPEPEARIGIMYRLIPFLPLLLALSTSSPFWAGYETGLLGYRNAANDALPRTGLPEMFRAIEKYDAYVQALVQAKIIPDSSYVWWALRPSLQHPTLELRLTDCCTALDDAIAIASLYRALVHHMVRHGADEVGLTAVGRALAEENRWRAQRYGTDGTYVDVVTHDAKPFATLLDETLALVRDDMGALGLEPQADHLRTIAAQGTSAHRQLALYRSLRKAGRAPRQAMRDVTKWLRAATEAGTFVDAESVLAPLKKVA
jgi:carboxylate-amine ligase